MSQLHLCTKGSLCSCCWCRGLLLLPEGTAHMTSVHMRRQAAGPSAPARYVCLLSLDGLEQKINTSHKPAHFWKHCSEQIYILLSPLTLYGNLNDAFTVIPLSRVFKHSVCPQKAASCRGIHPSLFSLSRRWAEDEAASSTAFTSPLLMAKTTGSTSLLKGEKKNICIDLHLNVTRVTVDRHLALFKGWF